MEEFEVKYEPCPCDEQTLYKDGWRTFKKKMKAFYYILTELAGIAIGVLLMWLLHKPIDQK